MRLIDADEVKRDLEDWCKEYPEKSESRILSEQLSKMLVEYLYEKPVFGKCVDAKWINPHNDPSPFCSNCGAFMPTRSGAEPIDDTHIHYCYECGAKMEDKDGMD